jgi:hypothetical protein
MNKEKWKKIYVEDTLAGCQKLNGINATEDPVFWPKTREVTLNFIKEMDKAYEVYMMENGKKE